MPAEVDPEKCTGCGKCVEECPAEAISLQNEVAVVDEDECTECGLCESVCEDEAITVE